LKLTVAIGAMDFVAGLCGVTIARFVNSDRDGYLISALIAAIIVCNPMFSLATLLYEGYRFENTPLDVECLFEEGA